MFKNEESKGVIKNIETIIGPSVKVSGDLNGEGSIIIEGIFEGSLKTNSDLQIGDKAKVTADIEANNTIISGKVNGNIKAKGFLELTKTAKIEGDVEAVNISIAQGALLNGKCTMTGNIKPQEK